MGQVASWRRLLVRLPMTPRDRKYRAKGDGVTDDGPALQRWLDDGGGELDARTYASGQQLVFPSGCRIEGVDKRMSHIVTHPSFVPPGGNGFFVNREQELTDEPATRGVRFANFSIGGAYERREDTVGIGLIGVSDSSFFNVAMYGFRWLVTPANTTRILLDHFDGYDWGCEVQPGDMGNIACEGGTALLGHSAFPNTHYDLINCHFHDGLWTAIDTSIDGSAHHWRIIRPVIERVHEAGIFGRLTDSCVVDAMIHDVKVRAVSAHGFEGGLVRSSWTGGTISATDGDSILMLGAYGEGYGTGRGASVVRDVGVFDPRRQAVGLDAAISIRAGEVDGLVIEDCYGSDFLHGVAAPIGFFGDGVHPMHNVLVRGRRFHGWTTGNVVLEVNDPRGDDFVIED